MSTSESLTIQEQTVLSIGDEAPLPLSPLIPLLAFQALCMGNVDDLVEIRRRTHGFASMSECHGQPGDSFLQTAFRVASRETLLWCLRAVDASVYGMANADGDTVWHTAAALDASVDVWYLMWECSGNMPWNRLCNARGLRPVDILLERGNVEVVKSMVNTADGYADCVFRCALRAAQCSTLEMLRFFVTRLRVFKYQVATVVDSHGNTLLHHALSNTRMDHRGAVDLLAQDVSPSVANKAGAVPLTRFLAIADTLKAALGDRAAPQVSDTILALLQWNSPTAPLFVGRTLVLPR